MAFMRGDSYTRDQIHAELGGETVSFLPQRDGRIVCGCFRVEGVVEDPGYIERKQRRSNRTDGILDLLRVPVEVSHETYYRDKVEDACRNGTDRGVASRYQPKFEKTESKRVALVVCQ